MVSRISWIAYVSSIFLRLHCWLVCQQFAPFPYVVTEIRLHCRCNPKATMNPTKVVIEKVESQRRSQVGSFLGESVGESSQSTHSHSHSQVAKARSSGFGNHRRTGTECFVAAHVRRTLNYVSNFSCAARKRSRTVVGRLTFLIKAAVRS